MNCDIAVVGGGPAGLSAAIQARQRGKSVTVVSGPLQDIPLYRAKEVDNYLGFPASSGKELLEAFSAHARQMGVARREGRVLNILPMDGAYCLSVGSELLQARAVVLASGVGRAAKLPGEAEYLGRGVSYCATCDGMLYRNRPVAVTGRASSAPEEANYLQEIGCQVTFVSAAAPQGLRPDIPVAKGGKLEIVGDGTRVTALRAGGQEIPCACVFLLQPSMAPSDLLPGLALEGSYIAVDRRMATSLPGVFAAGDCTGAQLQVSKAVGEGLVAGQSAAEYLDQLDRQS